MRAPLRVAALVTLAGCTNPLHNPPPVAQDPSLEVASAEPSASPVTVAFFLAASSIVMGTFVLRMGALGAAFLLWPAAGIVGSILALVARSRLRAGAAASTLGIVAGVLLLALGLPGFLVLGAAITLVVTRKPE